MEELDLSAKAKKHFASSRKLSVLSTDRWSAYDQGDIVILEDLNGVVSRRNTFNLSRRKLTFDPVNSGATAYRFSSSESVLTAAVGDPLLGLGDDDFRSLPLPFSFPFYGARYDRIFVNSDGNLTFVQQDSSSTARSLGRMIAGPPRISALFTDLDPSKKIGSVKVVQLSGRIVFTWTEVPVFTDFGIGPLQTFEIALSDNGKIEMSWLDISSSSAVVGISPGGTDTSPSLLSFASGSESQFTGAIAERFGNLEELDLQVAAQQFYRTHDDAYDFLVFYNVINVGPGAGVVAFANPVRDVLKGNGAPRVGDSGALFGSSDKLKAVLHMGTLEQYPADPNVRVPSRFSSGDTPLTVLGHEAGHLFLAYTSVRNESAPAARPMLGRSLFHWNFFFNSDASLLEGNRIADFGETANPRFVTTATVQGYSPLDQYLMSIRAAEEVPPIFLVENADAPVIGTSPLVGVRFNGNRREVKVEDIVAVEGKLTPNHTVAQRRFRFAFVLIVKEGTTPDPMAINQVDTLRKQFELAFHGYTGGRAQAETELKRNLKLSIEPYAGVLIQGRVKATLEIESPAEANLEVRLAGSLGLAGIPESLIIPAGSRRAEFEIEGLSPGVDEITAVAADSRYRRSVAKVQVLGRILDLQLIVESGDQQVGTPGVELLSPVVITLTDGNGVPYPGTKIIAAPSEGGIAEPAIVVTNAKGRAAVRWTPGPGPSRLTFSLEQAPVVGVTASLK